MTTLSRRNFIVTVAGGVALPLLAACGTVAPPQPSGPPGAGAPAAAKPANAYPTFAPAAGGPKPDFPAASPLHQDGFINYPKNPAKALPASPPPGLGSKVIAYTNNSAPAPPTPFDQNRAWQTVNKELNADVQFTIISQADYPVKLATVMAGNDLPDIMLILGPGPSGASRIQGLTQFLTTQCADLTPYLAGDAAKDYPNLAAIPTFAWKNSGCARNGKLLMLPIERYYPGSMLLKNSAVYDQTVGKDYVPKNAEDFKKVLQQLNKPSQNQWAIGSYLDQMYYIYYFAAMFGAPNGWGLDASGKLTRDIETPQYKEAMVYVRDLVVSGLYHPDALTIADSTIARNNLIGSKYVLDVETFGNAWQDAWTRGPKLNPPVTPQAVLPFPAHDGGKAQHYFGRGFFGMTAFKKATPERTKELLRISNYLAAPFGSAEDLLLTIGVKDVDYTVDSDGSITVLPPSNTDANSVPWKYIVQRPQVAYWPGVPDYAKAATDFEKVAISVGVSDPTLGFTSAALDSKGVPLSRALTDAITDLLAGRRPMSDWEQVVKDWQTNGGNEIRTELEKAIAARVTDQRRAFRFGVNGVTTSAQEWLDVARKAEALGYSTLIAQDHFGNQLAPLPALVAAGAVTSTLRLAAMVLDNDFRHPAAVAKEAATIDVLSAGRLELGLGAGWLQSDYDKTGIPYDAPGVRMERLAESVQICKAVFCSEEPVSFTGKYYRVTDLDTQPRPIQKPRPPMMIGGRQRRMLSLAAREADIVGISLLDRRGPGQPAAPSFAQKVEWVREAAGDRFSQLEIHVNASLVEITDTPDVSIEQAAARTGQTASHVRESPGTLVGSVEAIAEQLHARREQYGVTYYVVHGRVMDAFAPVLARLR